MANGLWPMAYGPMAYVEHSYIELFLFLAIKKNRVSSDSFQFNMDLNYVFLKILI